MNALNPTKTGIVVAVLIGGMHAFWLVLVAAGLAQPLIDFIFWIHFIRPVFAIESFEAGRALLLLGVTSAIGFIVGYILALLWNAVHK
jgi:hypothetical protein